MNDITTHDTTTHHRSRRRMNTAAICIYCGNDMYHGTSCIEDPIRINGIDYRPIRWGEEKSYPFDEMTERCSDCGVPRGAVHHHGCDLEECPACKGQMLGCGCTDVTDTPGQVEAELGQAEGQPEAEAEADDEAGAVD